MAKLQRPYMKLAGNTEEICNDDALAFGIVTKGERDFLWDEVRGLPYVIAGEYWYMVT